MTNLLWLVLVFISLIAIVIWALSKITVPLLKAGISLFLLIAIGGIVALVALAFWAMGLYAFIFIGLFAIILALKFFEL